MNTPSHPDLPPAARFALLARSSGATTAETAVFMRLDEATIGKHLRTALRELGQAVPPPSGGDAALEAALAPVLESVRTEHGAQGPDTCKHADVVDALAAGLLDGPLLLDTLERIGSSPGCLARLVRASRSESGAAERPVRAAKRGRGCVLAVVAVVAALGLVGYALVD